MLTATGFEYDDLYVQILFEAPEGWKWTSAEKMHSFTQVSRTTSNGTADRTPNMSIQRERERERARKKNNNNKEEEQGEQEEGRKKEEKEKEDEREREGERERRRRRRTRDHEQDHRFTATE